MKYSKTNATLLSFLLIILVSYPVVENWKSKPEDSFPMSYYPMFSLKRSNNYTLRHFVGYDKDENRHIISYRYVGKGGLNQIRRQINKMCRNGQEKKLINKVVKNIERRASKKYKNIRRIELVKADYDLEAFFINEERDPKKVRVLASREIKGKWSKKLSKSSKKD